MTLEGYRFALPMMVRFGDLDAMGHLNNTRYLSYMEHGRILYGREVFRLEGDWHQYGMILARTEIDYRVPVAFGDEVVVYVRVSRIGSKSFDFEMVITRRNGDSAPEIAAEAKAVMVAYDYTTNQTMPVPEAWRERIHAYEPAHG